MTWLNEPRNWKQENDYLTVFADTHTDFWRKTHYGFVRDNGHFYCEKVSGNFEIETEFRGEYRSLYDQAGVMVRLDETTWMKTGIEFVNGIHYVSAVVTRDYSDWSVLPFHRYPGSLRLRLKREEGAVTVEYCGTDGSGLCSAQLIFQPHMNLMWDEWRRPRTVRAFKLCLANFA